MVIQVVRESGVPDWAGRLVLSTNAAIAGVLPAQKNQVGSILSTDGAQPSWTQEAPTAANLATPRTISATGDVTWSVTFDGSANVTAAAVGVQAAKWTTARTLSFTGDVTGSGSVDGSANVATALTMATAQPSAHTWAATQTYSVAPTAVAYQVGGVQVVEGRRTGWGGASGTLSRAAYAAYAGQTYGVSYSETVAQATDNAVKLLAQTFAALITDLTAHGLIGP